MSNTHFIPKGTIISGFAGIGKTTAALKQVNSFSNYLKT